MAAIVAGLFHLQHDGLRLLIVEAHVLVFACSGQEASISIIVDGVQLVLLVVFALLLMQASAGGGVPMLQISIGLGTDKDIGSLHGCTDGSPSDRTYWHVVTSSILINVTAEGEGALSGVRIVDSNSTVSKAAS